MAQLTPHFTLEEMLRSDAAIRLSINEQFTPTPSVIDCLTALCINVLEPLRAKINQPITISSGYRCFRVNTAIGGANNSQHCLGQASDTEVNGMTVEAWYQFIKNSGIPFDQLIQEFGSWAHVSYNPNGVQRNQCLRATKINGNTAYESDGIVNQSA